MSFKVTINDLSKLFEIIIDKLKADSIDSIDVDMNGYWYVPTDEWNLDAVDNLAYGSLEEDWEHLNNLLEGKQITTYLDFERLASVLRSLSETIIPTK